MYFSIYMVKIPRSKMGQKTRFFPRYFSNMLRKNTLVRTLLNSLEFNEKKNVILGQYKEVLFYRSTQYDTFARDGLGRALLRLFSS